VKVISGGQTGVDQAALFAARKAGIETGGWAAKGWMTEKGPAPWLASYGLVECPVPGYPARTRKNAEGVHATLILAEVGGHSELTGGTKLTWDIAYRLGQKGAGLYLADLRDAAHVLGVVEWLRECMAQKPRLGGKPGFALNVGGPRESGCPGIGERAELFLSEVFRLLKGN
jgi:hypothetical protein